MSRGIFVISLDFEMMWGVADFATPEGYGTSNVAQVPQVLERLLSLFARYDIHATIAPVGLLMHRDKREALECVPSVVPTYEDKCLSPYRGECLPAIAEEYAGMYFAPQLVDRLKAFPNIEIGTHTYCHYYCNAAGQTPKQFDADLEAAVEISRRHGFVPTSIIFPRNNVNEAYLKVCAGRGVTVYRGNAKKYFDDVNGRFAAMRQRLCRLLDCYMNLGGHTSFVLSELKRSGSVTNVPASRFLRPYSHALRWLEPLRLRRIKREITYAAKHGEMYHLWWHPHNFGANTEHNFEFLEQILKHFATCRDKYAMKSLTMSETAATINSEQ